MHNTLRHHQRRAGPRDQIASYCTDSTQHSTQVVKINSKRQEAGLSQPIRLISVVFANATHIVQYDHPWTSSRTCRLGKIALHLPPRRRDEDVNHRIPSRVAAIIYISGGWSCIDGHRRWTRRQTGPWQTWRPRRALSTSLEERFTEISVSARRPSIRRNS